MFFFLKAQEQKTVIVPEDKNNTVRVWSREEVKEAAKKNELSCRTTDACFAVLVEKMDYKDAALKFKLDPTLLYRALRKIEKEETRTFVGNQERKIDVFFELDAPCVPVLSADANGTAVSMSTKETGDDDDSEVKQLHCLKLQSGIKPLARRDEMPIDVYNDGLLMHPAVPGLMLNRDERLYGAFLEISDSAGKIRMETGLEKRMRIKWKVPVVQAKSSTADDFVNYPALKGGAWKSSKKLG